MSVEMGAYLVNWDDFQEKVRYADAYYLLGDCELLSLSDSNASAPLDFLEAFDSFKRAWKGEAKLRFKEVYDTIFWHWRGSSYQIMEFEAGESEDSDLSNLDTALKPESVKEYADLSRTFDLEECRPLHEKFVKDGGRFPSFDDWKAYGEEWLAMLQKAAAQGKGFIIVIYD